jgi:serine/threonine protein kinase HipA of HipAB toxin-antitoxin module
MLLLLLMSFLLFQKEGGDALLAARINQLFHLVLTTDDKKQEAAAGAERFDRAPDDRRIHMEDSRKFLVLTPDNKYGSRSYANIAAVLWAETGAQGAYQFVRRLAFPF